MKTVFFLKVPGIAAEKDGTAERGGMAVRGVMGETEVTSEEESALRGMTEIMGDTVAIETEITAEDETATLRVRIEVMVSLQLLHVLVIAVWKYLQ